MIPYFPYLIPPIFVQFFNKRNVEKSIKIPYKQLHPWNQDNNPFNQADESHIRVTFRNPAIAFHDKYISIIPLNGQSSVKFLSYLGYMLTVKMIDYQADDYKYEPLYPKNH
jgi:hypothetical protein